jgi:hypothetical protein
METNSKRTLSRRLCSINWDVAVGAVCDGNAPFAVSRVQGQETIGFGDRHNEDSRIQHKALLDGESKLG